MDLELFGKSTAGKLVRAGLGDAAYWAFLPNPLPPELPLDSQLLRVSSDAAYALGQLAALGRWMPNPHLLIGSFVRREAVLSSRIEGTQADLAELYAYEAGQMSLPGFEPAVPASDVQEVLNYVGALEYGLTRLESLPVGERLMRELHERLLRGVRGERAKPGEFRRTQNWIGRPNSKMSEAEYVPPPPALMLEALSALEAYLHEESGAYPPLVRLSFIHYQFEAIHPFLDGNGRIGRLLISLLLVDWAQLPLPLLYLSAYFERDRQRYYDLLLAVSQRGAWHEWTLFFLQGVIEQSRDAAARAKRLQDLQIAWRDALTQGRASALLPKLADSLFASPILTIPRAQRLLEVTYHTAKSNVEKLVAAGILRPGPESAGSKTFVADEVLSIITA
jgi:Fic family protein